MAFYEKHHRPDPWKVVIPIGNCNRLQFLMGIATRLQLGSGLCTIGTRIIKLMLGFKHLYWNYNIDAGIIILTPEL